MIFRLIYSGLGLLAIVVGYIGYYFVKRKQRTSSEFDDNLSEYQKERERRAREEKELDDYMYDTELEYESEFDNNLEL